MIRTTRTLPTLMLVGLMACQTEAPQPMSTIPSSRQIEWHQIASGTTIGYKRIIPLAATTTTDALRIRLLDSRGPLTIDRIAVY